MWNQDEEDAPRLDKEERKRRKEAKKAALAAKAGPTPIYLPAYISVANLATMLKLRVEDFVRKLEELGFEEVQTDHVLNAEHAGLVAQEYNFEPIVQAEGEDQDLYPAPPLSPEDYAQLPSRPPVVTIMGHVDHGKTTILDYMRKSSVAATEFGGITQHIGAFSVPLASGSNITFLDTPGHAAFETMRARGANVTDIVVLVVAADDSVMPQTVEAIKHAQAARVPIIVAINKIDKQQADPERVKGDLGRHGIEVEDYGGDTQTVCVSGVTGQGISDLEEAISLQSEMLDHRADPKSNMEGWVLEGATKDRGKVATILVRSGTLRKGDVLVAGTTWARVRTLRNEAGVIVEEVGPGMPVEVDGWREQPIAGDEVLQASDEQQASSVAELRVEKVERERMAKDMDAVNESRRKETERREAERQAEEAAALALKNGEEVVPEEPKQESGPEIISFIVKGDVSGSVEAVIDSISAIGNNEVGTRILRHGVGAPSEFDVQHAADAKGHIVNFNTAIPSHIASMAEHLGVKILDSNIIYRVVENIKALLSEKLSDKITQRVTGEAEVAAVFDIGLGGRKKMKVAGSKVRNGIVEKGSKVKVLRGDKVVYTGMCCAFAFPPRLFIISYAIESVRYVTD
jgi:translation initiation factor IF-2